MSAMLADVTHGHVDLSDWLLLAAAIVFAVAALVAVGLIPAATTTRRDPDGTVHNGAGAMLGHGFLIAAGLCLVAVAWLVL